MSGGSAGRRIDGRFELVEPLGSGGMGTVWRARDHALEREVALKEVRAPSSSALTDEDTASRKLRERVLREARALARINHPGVVTIHHIVDQKPHPWLVMELVPGDNLHERLAHGPLEPTVAARIGRQILGALRAAHAAGIHHRDVKPANVLLRADGSAVLTDFGIAAVQGSTSVTATGELVGSPEYIAPERIRSAADHPAADLWSLGMLLYIAAEGHSPLRRETALATLAAVLDEPVPPPIRSGPLTPVLNALLVRDPAARPDAARLDAMLAYASIASRRAASGTPGTAERPDRRLLSRSPAGVCHDPAGLPVGRAVGGFVGPIGAVLGRLVGVARGGRTGLAGPGRAVPVAAHQLEAADDAAAQQ
ncbi:serine/threonine protein kinase [Streptomyces sp. P38-E01]|uniref:non-specific serine/threonine protein kinase n=1 Tax=Streptomyces tardus TaxID=2780544 RepID=A0A949JNT6_9ACTN|nr:serine/threonine protein kinase [Streptomyces tardus]